MKFLKWDKYTYAHYFFKFESGHEFQDNSLLHNLTSQVSLKYDS